MKLKSVCLNLFILTLASCNHLNAPNVALCGATNNLSAGADCGEMQTDITYSLTLQEFVSFLEPNPETQKGPALCMSSKDTQRIVTFIEQACEKVTCTKDFKKSLKDVSRRIENITKKPVHPIATVGGGQ